MKFKNNKISNKLGQNLSGLYINPSISQNSESESPGHCGHKKTVEN